MLNHLVGALADAAMIVRVEAAVALSRAGIPEAAALLRLKALSGDVEAEVTGQCLHSLLQMTPRDGVPFAARFLGQVHADDVRAEAASALAQSHEPTAIEALKSLWGTVLSAALRKALLPILASSPQRAAAEFLAGLGTEEARAALAESRFREEFG
jgi:HEAT repeat protein